MQTREIMSLIINFAERQKKRKSPPNCKEKSIPNCRGGSQEKERVYSTAVDYQVWCGCSKKTEAFPIMECHASSPQLGQGVATPGKTLCSAWNEHQQAESRHQVHTSTQLTSMDSGDQGIMLGYACEEVVDATLLTRPTATRLNAGSMR